MNTPLFNDSNLVLSEALASRIAESPQHRITFAQYMDMVREKCQEQFWEA